MKLSEAFKQKQRREAAKQKAIQKLIWNEKMKEKQDEK